MDKTKITHLGSEYAKFLGYYIKVNTTSQNLTSRTKTSGGGFYHTRKGTGKPKLIFPKDLIKAKLIEKGLANEKGKPKFNGKLMSLSDSEIVQRYNSIIRGFMNFYNIAENRSSMSEMVYIIEYSLAHTLAAKHRMSLKGVFTKYGKPIKVRIKSDKGEVLKTVEFDLPQSAEYLNKKYMKINRWNDTMNEILPYDPFNSLIHKAQERNILEEPCYICGATEDIEMHHLKHLKDTKDKNTLIKIMSRINRKTIPLCIPCHNNTGKSDGMSFKDIKKVCKFVAVFGEPYAGKLARTVRRKANRCQIYRIITLRVVDPTILHMWILHLTL